MNIFDLPNYKANLHTVIYFYTIDGIKQNQSGFLGIPLIINETAGSNDEYIYSRECIIYLDYAKYNALIVANAAVGAGFVNHLQIGNKFGVTYGSSINYLEVIEFQVMDTNKLIDPYYKAKCTILEDFNAPAPV